MTEVWVALIAAVAPTVVAAAAWRNARGANKATNAVKPGEPTLKEQVSDNSQRIRQLNAGVSRIEDSQTVLHGQHTEMRHELGRLAGHIESLHEFVHDVFGRKGKDGC